MTHAIYIIFFAYALDLIFGDPQWFWHPTRIIGRLIQRLEQKLNTGKINKMLAGVILAILVVILTAFSVWGILKLTKFIHPLLYDIVSVLFIYFALSIKQLGIEAGKVYRALREKDLGQARKRVSLIVARDTDKLDKPQIIRATVETVAESIMDGITAPLFYAFLGGPVLAWVYKAINTLDSMVGYRSERFIDFGRASAKLDGWINFIPARITCFFIAVSSCIGRKDWLRSMRWGFRYILKGPQDNSEAAEAAMAGALGIQLGGLNFYESIPTLKPVIGDNLNALEDGHIKESIMISYVSSVLLLASGIFLTYAITKRWGL